MNNKLKHLEFIQRVINRMASNLFFLRGWTVTLIAALFALFVKGTNSDYIFKNINSDDCREIIGVDKKKIILKPKTIKILDSSINSALLAIEIYNKPKINLSDDIFNIEEITFE